MFGSATTSEYDDIITKTTDENLTSENWELILNLCDKVQDEGQTGAHAAIAAILKRLAHRDPNVQLYALSLAEALSKNLYIVFHREIASKAFTQGLEKLITDGNTHEYVRRRALGLIAAWTADFEEDTSLGIMEECYNNLKAKNYKFEQPPETVSPAVDNEIQREEEEEEEEELQRALEMSMQDRVGCPQQQQQPQAQPQPQPHNDTSSIPSTSAAPAAAAASTTTKATPAATATSGSAKAENVNIVTRVRALHTFEPTEAGELAFEEGDVIRVVDRGYKDWWRGKLKGRTGIFPVNYVEAMPEPSAAELAREAEQEASVFAQAMNVEKLMNMLKSLDPATDNLVDNEEIQELYRSSMALQPKIVKLINKYSQKRADLVSMRETFIRARTVFDRMMEESLANIEIEQPYHQSQYRRRLDYQSSAMVPQAYGWKPNVFEQSAYAANPYPGQISHDPAGVPVPYGQTTSVSQQQQPQGYSDPYVSSPHGPIPAPPPSTAAIPQPQQHVQAAYGAHAVVQGGYGHQLNVPYTQQGPMSYPIQQQPIQQQLQQPQPTSQQSPQTPAIQQQPTRNPATQPQPVQTHPIRQPTQPQPVQQPTQPQPVQQPTQPEPVQQPTQPRPLPQQLIQPQLVQHASFAQHSVEQEQSHQQAPFAQHIVEHEQSHQQLPIQAQPETVQAQSQPQAQVRASVTSSVSPQRQAQPEPEPRYIYDPNTTYADLNVQAWAQYYAQGGRDLTGSVYFISIPGLTDNHAPGSTEQTEHEHDHHAAQNPFEHQEHQQPSSVADVGFKPSSSTRSPSESPTSETLPSWVLPKQTPPATVMGSPESR